jgi:hypothetical protein
MTLTVILSVLAAWLVASLVVGLILGRILRNAGIEEVCIEPGCQRPATHERLVGITTDHVPPGDPDGFSEHVELACRRHGEMWR